MSPKSCKCGNVLPDGDKHSSCVIHRRCSRGKPCKLDKGESSDFWDGIEAIRWASSRRSERDLSLERGDKSEVGMNELVKSSDKLKARVASGESAMITDQVDLPLGEHSSQKSVKARVISAAHRSEVNNSPSDAGSSIRAKNKTATLGVLSDVSQNGIGGASPPPISKVAYSSIESSTQRTINTGPVGNRVTSAGSHSVRSDVDSATCEPSRHDSVHDTSRLPIDGESFSNAATLSSSNMYYAYPTRGFGANIVREQARGHEVFHHD